MKPFFYYLLFFSIIVSCRQDRTVQLPEIKHANISKINDVSAAYLFYDETKADSVELNRKNLISTTNWLVNVDKRLRLKQAVPKIIYLQEKKRNAEIHKNDNAKNYFTCNDTGIKSLGFIEFTDVVYHQEDSDVYLNKNKALANQIINIKVQSSDSTYVSFIRNDTMFIHTSNQKELLSHLESNLTGQGDALIISEFSENLSFQDYITYKSILSQINFKNVRIANDEFIFN